MEYKLYDVAIKTANTKKLTKFYSEMFGFGIHHDCPQCTVLDMKNNQWLVIAKDKKFNPVKNPKTLRTTFGFKVENVDDVFNQLKAKKVKFSGQPADQEWGARTVSGFDPDGNMIDFIQEKPELAKFPKTETPQQEPVAA